MWGVMNGERRDFGETTRMPGLRESPGPAPGETGFLPREQLWLPRGTAVIVAVVVLVPLLAILVWLVLDAISAAGPVGV